jgi:endo-beta-N-acetylglucosaminidase D
MPREEKEPVEFEDIKAEAETEKAILVEIEGDKYWVPKSQVHEDSEVNEKGDEGILITTRWWAEKEGLA